MGAKRTRLALFRTRKARASCNRRFLTLRTYSYNPHPLSPTGAGPVRTEPGIFGWRIPATAGIRSAGGRRRPGRGGRWPDRPGGRDRGRRTGFGQPWPACLASRPRPSPLSRGGRTGAEPLPAGGTQPALREEETGATQTPLLREGPWSVAVTKAVDACRDVSTGKCRAGCRATGGFLFKRCWPPGVPLPIVL